MIEPYLPFAILDKGTEVYPSDRLSDERKRETTKSLFVEEQDNPLCDVFLLQPMYIH